MIITLKCSNQNLKDWKLDKYWLYVQPWKGKWISENSIEIKDHPPLTSDEFSSFKKSKEIVPSKMCRLF